MRKNVNAILPISNGKMAIMIATVELDKLGRFVVPKKVRDALHLRTGDKLDVDIEGERLILARKPAGKGLYKKNGWLVYDSGGPPLTLDAVNRWIEQDREDRDRRILGIEEEG
jgi:AbrB family looped-hinge helix DNA binding protein